VPSGDSSLTQSLLHSGWQLKEAQSIGHRRPALPNSLGDLVVRMIEVFDQLLVSGGLLERTEIFSVKVLYQCLLETLGLNCTLHDDRYGL
jgi:hypothetical protein